MQRYFVKPNQIEGQSIIIRDDDAHHIIRVMRMKEDEQVIVSDNETRTVIAKIVELGSHEVKLEVVEESVKSTEPIWQVSIAQALPKGDKMELIVQKCTEVGAVAFIPFESQRVIVQYDHKKEAKRIERWQKIVKEAAEQSHRNKIATVESTKSFKQLLEGFKLYDLVLFCYEETGKGKEGQALKDVLQTFKQEIEDQSSPVRILVIAGSEGGFTEQEATLAKDAGAKLVGLGKRILRAETAGIVALTCIMYESGEMGGV